MHARKKGAFHRWPAAAVFVLLLPASLAGAAEETIAVTLSGVPQEIVLYRPAKPKAAVILSSGDLGWAGFVVDVAHFLENEQVAVLGFNTRRYLESFTRGDSRLDPMQLPKDYAVLAREARLRLGVREAPALVGISEGAGFSVIAAAVEPSRSEVRGVVCLGLPDEVELGWRAWRDWTIWITKGSPNEPKARLVEYVSRVTPLPLVVVQSTRDEFVPLETARSLFAAAAEPKRLMLIDAANHRFSDKREELHARLLEALGFVELRES